MNFSSILGPICLKIKRYRVVSALLGLSLLGNIIFIMFFARQGFSYSALDLELKLQFTNWGKTILSFPPMGKIEARTHLAPFSINLALTQIDASVLKEGIGTIPAKSELISGFSSIARSAMAFLSLKICLFSLIVTLILIFLARFRKFTLYLCGAAFSLLISLLLLGPFYISYSAQGFTRPKYAGVLEAAPWMVNLASEGLGQLEVLGRRLQTIVGNLPVFFERMKQMTPLATADGDIKVLHVSDIHNNPAALSFIHKMVSSFNVAFIIDTGDITDFGTALEAEFIEDIKKLNVPYIITAGNHDSPEVISYLKQIKGISFLDGEIIMKGLRIFGRPDPAYYHKNALAASPEEINETKEQMASEILNREVFPDIVAVHNIKMAEKLIGHVPVVLHGHNHRLQVYTDKGTRIIDAGTTGAAGIRGLEKEGVPYSVALLHFTRIKDNYFLAAVDTIKVYSLSGKFLLERKVFDQKKDGD